MEFSLIPAQHYPVTFMDSPLNGNTSLQTSVSNLNASFSRPDEQEDEGKLSSDAIWLWVAIIATVCNIVVVAVVCACAF
ncbi:uncharacterized protein C14orf132 [Ictalurus furcatus]|uniref:uncharacterized protein C14orf132 n=1 Tax=Ictalurus furcatus TaxID=66913 RepID=UPI0023505256|nr:uncharacterized protein C14orf132 [Ictalurus furcatus]